jgi:diguanylate cyclase (GGDEF)-like protein/PAS domain S-box-containing protein
MAEAALDFDFFDDNEGLDAAALTQKTLIDTQERMGMMLDVMPMGFLIHTQQGILFANREACRLLEVGKVDAIGQHFLDFISTKEFEKIRCQFDRSFRDEVSMEHQETQITRTDGDEIHIKLISCRLPWQGNPVIQVLLQDVTDLKKTEQKLRRLTVTDELTGAYNRRHVFDVAKRFLAEDPDAKSPLSAILVDVDHFKRINDTYGHSAGDAALIELTRLGNEIVGQTKGTAPAIFSRIGGEEFLAVLPGIDADQALEIADKLRAAVAAIRVRHAPNEFGFTASMGVASLTAQDRDFEGALSRADTALYAAKAAGRNCVKVG